MSLPAIDTPLYNHPLPQIEQWLRDHGCQQDEQELNTWYLERPNWQAEIVLEIEELAVRYHQAGADGRDIVRSFKYSLSRGDVEAAVFDGP
ncbi:MAG: DUF3143 domain-containing protein [Spirulinaceae cyanobacterium RM2_2_10]|nr:DUF3143 domain-containing protein [Spirulinaceae cyanobacterium SM2_1_0]NJO21200.1 DUF3143 domain-containing protein [Spirulinaceae cyanobacterium RM2_2_10]